MLASLLGGGAAKPIEAVGNIVDQLFTSEEEKLDKQAVLERIRQKPDLAQAEINKVEAGHRSIFVAGWRPFIGWVCGFALAYSFILRDLAVWTINSFAPHIVAPPALHLEHLISIVLALLGLGGLRSFEKMKGRAK